MSERLTPKELDEILALQFSVAWAGESGGAPPRLGWWRCDLIDVEGGGDLLLRLLPKTHEWAGLSLARRAAGRVDAAARQQLAQGDSVRTLFHLGFSIDEQLCDRVAHHRRHGHKPSDVLGAAFDIRYEWSPAALEARLVKLGSPKVKVTPGGRRLGSKSASAVEQARLLAAALLPLSERYPLPFLEAAV